VGWAEKAVRRAMIFARQKPSQTKRTPLKRPREPAITPDVAPQVNVAGDKPARSPQVCEGLTAQKNLWITPFLATRKPYNPGAPEQVFHNER